MNDNKKDQIFLMTSDNDLYLKLLENRIEQYSCQITDNKTEATIVLADPPLVTGHLNEFSKLEWLQSTFAGIDHLTRAELRHDYLLTNIKGPFGQLISEYVLGYTLSHTRHFNQYQIQQHNRQWLPHSYHSLNGKNVVMLGTGTIAREVARNLSILGLVVSGVNTSGIPPKNSPFGQVFHTGELNAALNQAHIIVNTLPHTPETVHILNADAFSVCQNVLLFNVGRGSAISDDDLLQAITQNQVTHAYLDVFTQEPLPSDHPFWHHPSITVTPHIAAVSFPEQVADIFIQNLLLWRQGEPLNFEVNFQKGY